MAKPLTTGGFSTEPRTAYNSNVEARREIARALVFLMALGSVPTSAAKNSSLQVIAYVFVKDRVLTANEIDARKLTRINYAFADIRNGEIVEGFAHDAENFAVLTGLKKINPNLQVLISVGGWTWSGNFSDMALTPSSRVKFIESVVRFATKYNLDGLDIDWEYPGLVGMGNKFRPEDGANFTSLVKELRVRFDAETRRTGRRLYTSIAAGASSEYLMHTQMGTVARYLDTVNLMSYDYYESSSSAITGHHAPLHTNPADPKKISAEQSVTEFLAAGVPAHKLVLGVPFYGHAWGDVGPTDHGLFQPGKPTQVEANYQTITRTLLQSGYTRYWDAIASAPYLYNAANKTFVSYEDEDSVRLKARFVVHHNLGGIMFWEYHGDSNGALLNAIHAGFHQ